jgi:tetratricopeptide (TPR) repeat protein
MTNPDSSRTSFVRSVLPWLIVGVATALYLATLNHWVSISSLMTVAQVAGWDWRPAVTSPLLFVLTLPARGLPPNLQPVVLNLFAAVCSALTLGLLARSVALLPHDRTKEQRQRGSDPQSLLSIRLAWIPPLLAALMLGFQLTFWENATAFTNEALDLLLFAYLCRCLLEYRISQNERWLAKLAFVYGLGVTNNWTLINYFPLFLIALVWMKGIRFFDARFMTRLTALGLAGLLLYLLLPAIATFSEDGASGFWPTLKTNLGFQKSFTINSVFVHNGDLRWDLFTLCLTSVLPIFFMVIRWPSFFGDISAASGILGGLLFRVLHVAFLAFGLWLFFDPKFSGRTLGLGFIPFLSFYYLAALAVGYMAGYALLVFGTTPERQLARVPAFLKLLEKLFFIGAIVACACTPFLLAWKNLQPLRVTNGPELRRYASTMADLLPKNGAVVLSDDLYRLMLVRGILQSRGTDKTFLFLETASLPFKAYHVAVQKKFPAFIDVLLQPGPLPDTLDAATLLEYVDHLGKDREVWYLHASFGYYFERFYSRPHGLIYRLQAYKAGQVFPPALTPDEVARNKEFWSSLAQTPASKPAAATKASSTAQVIGMWYSQAATVWGVELQKLGQLDQAAELFTTALQCNPQNLAATVNMEANTQLRSGAFNDVISADELEKKVSVYRSWDRVLSANGPFDHPVACLRLGQLLSSRNNIRQGTHYYQRVLDFEPANHDALVGLIGDYIQMRFPDEALRMIAEARAKSEKVPLTNEQSLQLSQVEVQAYLAKNDPAIAEELLLDMLTRNPDEEQVVTMLLEFYVQTKRLAEGLEVIEKQLRRSPENPQYLFARGIVYMHLQKYDEAVRSLNEVLQKQPRQVNALFNRALCLLLAGRLNEAKRDYDALDRMRPPQQHSVYYGLGEIAYQQKNKAEAVRNYRLYLKTAPAGTEEYDRIQRRLAELESGSKS